MNKLAQLLAICIFLGGCGEHEVAIPKMDPAASLERRIGETGHVSFESWNGKLRGVDSDSILHFYKDSKVVLEDRGISVAHYEGSYDLRPDGRVAVMLKRYREDWPLMILRLEGTNLLLYREDGHTSWLPKDFPDPDPQADGYWPFRATNKAPAQQAGSSNGG